MIPIVTISAILPFIVLLFIIYRVYSSYRKTKSKTLKYFLGMFISLGVGILVFLPNGLITKDLKIINLIFNIYTFFYFLARGFSVALTFEIMNRHTVKKIAFITITIFGIILSLITTIKFEPATLHTQGFFIFWEDTRGEIINILTGIGLLLPSLWVFGFFLYNGLKSEDKYIRNKSLFMSAGMVGSMLGVITDFVFGSNPNIFYISIYTAFWYITALLMFLMALEYKKEISLDKKENIQLNDQKNNP